MRKVAGLMVVGLAWVVGTGCPNSGGGNTSSSGGSNGGSSGGSSGASGSSSGGSSGVTGDPIPLDQLCPVIANGYLRYNLALFSGGAFADPTTPVSCSQTVPDDELYTVLFGDVEAQKSELCSPDGGLMFVTVADISRAVGQGRVAYHADRVGTCVASGRQLFDRAGGLFGAFHGVVADAGPESDVDYCGDAVEGLQDDGEPCRRDIECAPGDAGSICHQRNGQSCEGLCRRLRLTGEECETGGFTSCSGNNTCIYPGEGLRGICAPAAALNQPCEVDGGEIECEEGLRCSGGRCLMLLGAGTGCESSDDCQDGLQCAGTPARCMAPPPAAATGQPCGPATADDRGCAPCETCFTDNPDAGAWACVSTAKVGTSCTSAPCELGFWCINGTCTAPAAPGAQCARDDRTVVDEAMRGNCRLGEACTGSPATCQARANAGQTCTTDPVDAPLQGTCAAGLVCRRSGPSATSGTCQGPVGEGEACGDRFDLTEACQGDMDCQDPEDGGVVGWCGYSFDAPAGAGCATSSDCASGLFCATADGGRGTCTVAPGVGSRCDNTGYTCTGSYCALTTGDAGTTYVCAAFKALNAACTDHSECGPTGYCPDTNVCTARKADGQACDLSAECDPASSCYGGICTRDACEPFARGMDSCADGGYVPVLLFFGTMMTGARWRRRRAR